jgi:hypothetical protein
MHRVTARLTFTLVFLVGCSIKLDGDSGSASTGMSASESTSSGAETSDPLGHSSAPTGGIPGGTEGPTTTDADTGASGSSTDSGDSPTACGLMCQHAAECQLNADPDDCATLCEGDLAEASPDCAAATQAMLACFVGLTCEQLALAQSGQLGHPCGSAQIDRNTACNSQPDSCDTGGGGNFDGSSCEVEAMCPGQPLHRMECDTQQCVCLEDGVPVGGCPADNVCNMLETLGAKTMSCCGFAGIGP